MSARGEKPPTKRVARGEARKPASRLRYEPLDDSNWSALAKLFGPKGAYGGCWCMWWRLRKRDFDAQRGTANKRALRRLARDGRPIGVLAFDGTEAVGWCAVAPREDTPRIERSRNLKPFDDARDVWSVTCLFVAPAWRGRGMSSHLLRAATDYAREQGARIVEGYPVQPRKRLAPSWIWTGVVSSYERTGFVEVHRRSDFQPILRRTLRRTARARPRAAKRRRSAS